MNALFGSRQCSSYMYVVFIQFYLLSTSILKVFIYHTFVSFEMFDKLPNKSNHPFPQECLSNVYHKFFQNIFESTKRVCRKYWSFLGFDNFCYPSNKNRDNIFLYLKHVFLANYSVRI
jgi:hypothetical protein